MRAGSRSAEARWRSATLITLLALAPGVAATEQPSITTADSIADASVESRYVRTTAALADAPADWRADFAQRSLLLLAEIYLAESELARYEASEAQGAQAAKLRGWSAAVEAYGEQLLLVLEDVELGFPADVLLLGNGGVALQIAGRTVMLNHPRVTEQAVLERQLLTSFCSIRDCQQLTPPVEPEPIPMTPPTVTVDWAFSESGPVCRSGTISVQFERGANLSRQRPLCTQLVQELLSLELELRWQIRHGVTVDYDNLALSPTPGKPEHLVLLNNRRDSVLLSLPVLSGTTDLLPVGSDWLARRIGDDQRNAELSLNSADFHWH